VLVIPTSEVTGRSASIQSCVILLVIAVKVEAGAHNSAKRREKQRSPGIGCGIAPLLRMSSQDILCLD